MQSWQQYWAQNENLGFDEALRRFRKMEQQDFEEQAQMFEAKRAGSTAKANSSGSAGGGQLAIPNLTASSSSAPNTAILNWSAVTGTTNYILQRATNATFTSGLTTVYSGVALTKTDGNLAISTHFFYRVKAQKTGSPDSAWSNIEEVTTTGSYGGALGFIHL